MARGPQHEREHRDREKTGFYVFEFKKWEKVLHPLARETQKHVALCNLKGILQRLWMTKGETRAEDIPPRSFPTPY